MNGNPVTRIIIFGSAVGAITIGSAIAGIALSGGESDHLGSLEWLGYLVMILALSLVFVGVKRYRDVELGGVIRFGQAFLVGLGISLMASAVYVIAWEVYLALSGHTFIEQYAAAVIRGKEAEGASAAELQELAAEMAKMQQQYANPLFRVAITFSEIFPVGLLVSLIGAAVLRTRGLAARAAGRSSRGRP